MTDSNDYRHWIQFAKNDLAVAKDLQLQNEYVYQAVVTHCQQSIEKYLKSFLLYSNKKIIFTHDLLILCKLCEEVDIEFNSFQFELNKLSVNYKEARYPGDFEDIDLEDANKALVIAVEFENFIQTKFVQ